MSDSNVNSKSPLVIDRQSLQKLLDVLAKGGYSLIGPRVRDQAMVYDEISSDADLPIGWTDKQDGGTYRLTKDGHKKLFDFTVGSQSWKKFLYAPVLKLWEATRDKDGFKVEKPKSKVPKQAFIGVRACELAAMAIHDNVFTGEPFSDPAYIALRQNAFIVAVNCGRANNTCFCDSMKTGPRAKSGYDLALTEVVEGDRHYFMVEIGSELGAEFIDKVPHQEAQETEKNKVNQIMANTVSQMGRKLDTNGLKEILQRNLEHSRWDEVSKRCLNCSNCTLVCPTCFCMTVEEGTDLAGQSAERVRKWDSCFRVDFSYIFGGSIRPSGKARYRQWLTHKLANWVDQYGTMGCVGCGRCITWCPVGIDITEEATAIRNNEKAISTKG